MDRNHTKIVQIGDVRIGGGNRVAIQSMTNTRTEDVQATVKQILDLEKAGCDIVRCTVPTIEAAKAIGKIKEKIHNIIKRNINIQKLLDEDELEAE